METKTMAIKKSNFAVTGMTCASCARSVERILSDQKGVISAAVNLANEHALVEYDEEITNKKSLQKAVQSIGYDLMVENNNAQNLSNAKQQR